MSNDAEFNRLPTPHPEYGGRTAVVESGKNSFLQRARLWQPVKTTMENLVATVSRFSHRLIDRTTGIPYSADELETKILAQAGGGSTDTITTADGSAAAAAGKLGEVIENGPAAYAAMTSPGPAQSIASITLTPGDWSVSAGILFRLTSGDASSLQSAIHTSVTIPFSGFPLDNSALANGQNGIFSITHHARQIRVAANTTYNLVVAGTFTGTIEAAGILTARRVR